MIDESTGNRYSEIDILDKLNLNFVLVVLVGSGLLAAPPPALSADDNHHPHHVAIAGGVARHGNENSSYIGADYVYTFRNGYSAAVFVEQVRGDFNISAFGAAFGKFFDSGWKAFTGPGIETKLKNDKNLFLWHMTVGYDWHSGGWSFGPLAGYDFIEDASNTVYLGFSVGYGF